MAIVQVLQFKAHLAAAPVLDWVGNGPDKRARCTFVAITNDVRGTGSDRRERTASIRWTAWGPQAEQHAQRLSKGALVNVIGRMDSTRWVDADSGRTVYGFDFTVESVDYLDSRGTADARRIRRTGPARQTA
jgi:single-stranded DNA-binding protein